MWRSFFGVPLESGVFVAFGFKIEVIEQKIKTNNGADSSGGGVGGGWI